MTTADFMTPKALELGDFFLRRLIVVGWLIALAYYPSMWLACAGLSWVITICADHISRQFHLAVGRASDQRDRETA